MNVEYTIKTIKNYPDNGKHQECFTELPFEIRKGEDGYFYGNEESYNIGKSVTKLWICHLESGANESLRRVFTCKKSIELKTVLNHCVKLYKKSLIMEIERIQNEIEKYN